MAKPKVLFLTGALPYPLVTGAKIRTFNLLKALAAEFDIDLLTVTTDAEDKKHIHNLTEIGIACHYLLSKKIENPMRKARDAALSFICPAPYLVRHYTLKEYRNKLESLLHDCPYDVIHCDSISMTGNLYGLDKNRLVLTQHNIEQNIWAGYVDHAGGPMKWFYRNQYTKVARLEANLDKIYGFVVTVSEADRKTLAGSFREENIIVVENGVDPDAYRTEAADTDRGGIIFTGSLDWYPNIDGLTWFLDKIHSHIQKHAPESKVTVVGRKPSRKLRDALSAAKNISLYADVPEIQPYLCAARVMMVPLRIGGGSRLKILEALAAGVPVVSTSKGAEGLAVENGEHILIEDDPKGFAEALAAILHDDRLHESLVANAKELIENRYTWEKVSRPLALLWKRIADA